MSMAELVECMGNWHGCPLDPAEAGVGAKWPSNPGFGCFAGSMEGERRFLLALRQGAQLLFRLAGVHQEGLLLLEWSLLACRSYALRTIVSDG